MPEHKIRALIVDDEKIVRDFFKRLLAFLGVEALDADSGASAIELVRQKKFDLFFIDVRMPELNGLDTYRQIRKLDPEATVVMMTGYAVEEILKVAQKEGAFCHIHKPFDITEIKDIITKISQV
ncbi:MAG: response regulator [Candidatus Omnitrophota bacterium]|nr:response regulator [Candidatus Omnitrophota bacterium]